MTKFNFELDSVLNYKRQSESNKKNQLMKEIGDLNTHKEDLDSIVSSMDKAVDSFSHTMKDNVSILNIQSHYDYMSTLENAKRNKERDIHIQTTRVDNTRNELIDIARSKKSLELLEEKKYEDFKKEILQAEQNANDERNCYNHSIKDSIKNTI